MSEIERFFQMISFNITILINVCLILIEICCHSLELMCSFVLSCWER